MLRFKPTIVLAAAVLLCASACKKNQEETVEPEDDTWIPDESLEPEPAPAAPQLSEEERLEQAKGLYIEAEGKAGEGDWDAALPLYEQAYYLVPTKHGFALKVGTAAEAVGDCNKAIEYYQHFVTYAEPDKYASEIKSTKKSLAKLQKSCEAPAE